MINLEGSKVLVTGGEGFLGSAVCDTLKKRKAQPIVFKHSELDLLNLYGLVQYLNDTKPDYCIHCAGYNGGIEFNRI